MDINIRISVTNEGQGTQAKLKAIAGLSNLRLQMGYVFTATVTGEEWDQIDKTIATIKKTPDVALCRYEPFTEDIIKHLAENGLKENGLIAKELNIEGTEQTKKVAYVIVTARCENTVKRMKITTSGLIDWMP